MMSCKIAIANKFNAIQFTLDILIKIVKKITKNNSVK